MALGPTDEGRAGGHHARRQKHREEAVVYLPALTLRLFNIAIGIAMGLALCFAFLAGSPANAQSESASDCIVTYADIARALKISEEAAKKMALDVAKARFVNSGIPKKTIRGRIGHEEREKLIKSYEATVRDVKVAKSRELEEQGRVLELLNQHFPMSMKEGRGHIDFGFRTLSTEKSRQLLLTAVRQGDIAEIKMGEIADAKELMYLIDLQRAAPADQPVRILGTLEPKSLNRANFLEKGQVAGDRQAFEEAVEALKVSEGCRGVWTKSQGRLQNCERMRFELMTNAPRLIRWRMPTRRANGI